MWKYYKRVLARCWDDGAGWARDNLFAAAIMSILPAVLIWVKDKSHPLDWSLIATILEAYCGVAILYFLAPLLRSPWKMDAEHAESARKSAATIQSLEQDRDTKLPAISIAGYEAILVIDETWNAVDVFVDAEIENRNHRTPFIPTLYQLQLDLPDKRYSTQVGLRDLCLYQVFDCYQIEDDGHLVWEYQGHKPLEDLAASFNHKNPVAYGVPRRGWMHFRLENLPPWPTHEENTGDFEWETDVIDEDGDTVSLGDWVPVTKTVKSSRHVKFYQLIAHVQGGSSSTFCGSINHSGRREIGLIPKKLLDSK